MVRFSPWMIFVAVSILGFWMPSCDARGAGGGGGGRAGGGGGRGGGWGEDPVVPPVEWSPNIPDAEESSKQNERPYLIYFCTEDVAKFAGTGSDAIKEYKKTNKITASYTPFENLNFVDTLKQYGYSVVKVVASPQTIAVAKKYKVGTTPALIACAPTGEVLAQLQGEQCTQTNMLNLIKELKNTYELWKKIQEAKEAAKAKDADKAKEADKPAEGVAGATNPPANPPAPAGNDGP
jgi:thioredoxin-related protein